MRSVEPFNFMSREHRALMFDLALVNKRHLLNDVDRDIPLILHEYQRRADSGDVHAFIAIDRDEYAGIFWIEVDRYGIGRIRGGLFPEFRDTWNGVYFLKWMVSYAFETLGIRKLESELALYNKKDRESAAAEKLLKRMGFKKRAILPQSLMIGGKAKDTILLDYLKDDYDGIKRK